MANNFIYVAGFGFPIEWDLVVPWFQQGGFNSHLLYCVNTKTGPNSIGECVAPTSPPFADAESVRSQGFGGGIVPYDQWKKTPRPHDFRFRARRSMGALGRPNRVPRGPEDYFWPVGGDLKTKFAGPDALRAAQATIRQFVIHHDGCADADMTYTVLHNERGLSVHFILQNDGVIFQTLDCALAGFQCKSLNETSIGIEMNNRGEANKYPDYYGPNHRGSGIGREIPRDIVTCQINSSKILSYGYTKVQMKAMHALDHALRRALPNLPPVYPQIAPGVQNWRTLDTYSLYAYTGWLGHYHETGEKWDPGPFDFKDFFLNSGTTIGPISSISRTSFPVAIAEEKDPVIDPKSVEAKAEHYHENNEKGDAGFFPIGREPFTSKDHGEMRLWHLGVHLNAEKATNVVAPFQGRVLAARMAPDEQVGSVNFVLMKHDIAVGPRVLHFYSLYFHLLKEDLKGKIALPAWFVNGKPVGEVGSGDSAIQLYSEPVEAGDLLGHVGEAGPEEPRKAQLHFSIFATEELGSKLDPPDDFWMVLDGTAGGRFCVHKDVIKPIDSNKDQKISREELLHFFQDSTEKEDFRKMAIFAVSEWSSQPDWNDSLKSVAEFSSAREREKIVEEQISPTLWWTDNVAKHAALPKDAEVFSYQPISFVSWLNQKLAQPAPAGSSNGGISNTGFDKTVEQTKLKGDYEDETGDSFVDESDLMSADEAKDLTIEDLAKGYPDDK